LRKLCGPLCELCVFVVPSFEAVNHKGTEFTQRTTENLTATVTSWTTPLAPVILKDRSCRSEAQPTILLKLRSANCDTATRRPDRFASIRSHNSRGDQ